MKGANKLITVLAAITFALVIAGAQLAWNLRTASYLKAVAQEAGTHAAIAQALPDYAAKKLPNSEATKEVFAKNVSASSVGISLQSLYDSLSAAYVGKTDMVELDLGPITRPVEEAGYQIPPGTVFAQDSIQIGGIAPVLRTTQRVLLPSIVLLIILLVLVALLGVKRSSLRAIRSVLLITALILAGLYVATLGVPMLVSSLVSSSSLDVAMRDILLTFADVVITDTGRYYIAWIALLVAAAILISIISGLTHRRKRPPRHNHKQPKVSEAKGEEL